MVIIPTNLVTSWFLSPPSPFVVTRNKNQIFSKLVIWKRKPFFIFCSWQVALFFKGMPSSIYFYKGICLHAILARVIASWYNRGNFLFWGDFSNNIAKTCSYRLKISRNTEFKYLCHFQAYFQIFKTFLSTYSTNLPKFLQTNQICLISQFWQN